MRPALNRTGGAVLAGLIAGAISACVHRGPPEMVVLVPDRDGKVGTVVVESDVGRATLNKPYAAARLDTGERTATRSVSEGEVKKAFAGAITAQPLRPVSFLLYFLEGTDEYTQESKDAFEKVFAEIARRKVAEVAVIGHTDTAGPLDFNDALSLKRAERVRRNFVERGIPANSISIAGRGERELLVPTADEVLEARNRRVEISIR